MSRVRIRLIVFHKQVMKSEELIYSVQLDRKVLNCSKIQLEQIHNQMAIIQSPRTAVAWVAGEAVRVRKGTMRSEYAPLLHPANVPTLSECRT